MIRISTSAVALLASLICAYAPTVAARSAKPGAAAVRRIPLPDSLLIGELRAAAWSAQGSIALLDARERRVIVLDPTGRVERIVGRRGSGPGEFQFPGRVGFRRDTVWVIDGGLQRITFLPRVGPSVTVPWSRPSPGAGLGAITPWSLVHGDRVLATPSILRPGIGVTISVSSYIGSLRSAEPLDSLWTSTSRSGAFAIVVPNGSMMFTNPFTSHAVGGASTNGRWLARLDEYDARSQSRALEWRDLVGGTRRSIRVPCTEGLLSAAARAEVIDGLVASAASAAGSAERARKLIEEQLRDVPATAPCARNMVVGIDGTVAVLTSVTPEQQRWRVWRAGGTTATEVVLPGNARLYEVRATAMLVNEPDEDDLPSLLIRPLP